MARDTKNVLHTLSSCQESKPSLRHEERTLGYPTAPAWIWVLHNKTSSSNTGLIWAPHIEHITGNLTRRGFSVRAGKAVSRQVEEIWPVCEVIKRVLRSKSYIATSGGILAQLRNTRSYNGSTLGTYLAAISSVLTMANEKTLTMVPELIALLRSYKVENQKKFIASVWDLNIEL